MPLPFTLDIIHEVINCKLVADHVHTPVVDRDNFKYGKHVKGNLLPVVSRVGRPTESNNLKIVKCTDL